jgi:hypothetical protein
MISEQPKGYYSRFGMWSTIQYDAQNDSCYAAEVINYTSVTPLKYADDHF